MTKKIRLISLATTYPDSSNSTKPSFVHLLNKELVNLGIDVLTICPQSNNASKYEIIEGVKIKRFKFLPKRFVQSTTSIPDEIRSKSGFLKIAIMITSFFFVTLFSCLKNKPDIVHGQWAFPGGYIAYLMSKIFSTKAIVTVHYAEIPLLQKFKFLRNRVVNGLNKSCKVIAVSNYTKRKLIELGVKEENIIVIRPTPNFVPHISDKEFLNDFRKKFVSQDHKIILFCGRLVEHKGVQYLIQSIPKIETENIHLIIVGDGIMKEKLQKLSGNLGLDDKITFYGKATNEELGWIHDISDVFVCPSIIDSRGNTEGLGLVIPEAMESGLPVIASSVGGIVDIIKNQENGLLVPEKDPDSIAKAVDNILTDSDLNEKVIYNSKDTVKEFSPQNIAKQHMEIFKNNTFC